MLAFHKNTELSQSWNADTPLDFDELIKESASFLALILVLELVLSPGCS